MNLMDFETKIFQEKGYRYIGGIDEVGRGCLAGPLVTAIVVLDMEKMAEIFLNQEIAKKISAIKDSKKLSEKRREELADFIKDFFHYHHIQETSNSDIDSNGISQSTNYSFLENFNQAKSNSKIDFVFTDAFKIRDLDEKIQESLIRGDNTSLAIASASIIAKVYRDNLMKEIATQEEFKEYDFDSHKGYGTAAHIEKIKRCGVSSLHRKSFEPIKSMLII